MPAIGNIDELVATVGFTAFETLVRVRGGRRLYVPTDIESAQQIVQWLGQETAGKLVDAYGGFAVDIPNRRPVTMPTRKPVIEALIAAGKSDAEIVEVVECTERTVRACRAELRRREALPGLNARCAS